MMLFTLLFAAVTYLDDAAGASQPKSEPGSVIRLNLDIDVLTQKWMDRQGIKNPMERQLMELVFTGRVGKEIDNSTRECKNYIVIVDAIHSGADDWPKRLMEIRPENLELDALKLLSYRSIVNDNAKHPLANISVICISDRNRPQMCYQTHLRYTDSKWETAGEVAQGPPANTEK